jgi:hypothetical protein
VPGPSCTLKTEKPKFLQGEKSSQLRSIDIYTSESIENVLQTGLGPVAHASNPSYLGGRNPEACYLKPIQEKISKTPSQE